LLVVLSRKSSLFINLTALFLILIGTWRIFGFDNQISVNSQGGKDLYVLQKSAFLIISDREDQSLIQSGELKWFISHSPALQNTQLDNMPLSEIPVIQQKTTFDTPMAKNVILFIGDGMGEQHLKAARWSTGGLNGRLSMDDLEITGHLNTASANRGITDSAAASTAMATGVMTNNGVIGLDRNREHLPTILEQAKQQGKSVGLVTTKRVTDATPAAFTAHIRDRYLQNDIARQYLTSGVNVILGGGENDFLPNKTKGCFSEFGQRTDGRDLLKEFTNRGYIHLCGSKSLSKLDTSGVKYLIGLFADEGMKYPYSPSLAEMTIKAIEILSQNPNGYFLLVEAGQIDTKSHDNKAQDVINRTITFDKTIKLVTDLPAVKTDTLVIITADHETGGLITSLDPTGLPGEAGPLYMPDGNSFYMSFTSTYHTADPVPVMASGPLAHWFSGIHDNTYVFDVMSSAIFGINDLESIFLPPDIDGDGIDDHASVCPLEGNLYLTDTSTTRPYKNYLFGLSYDMSITYAAK
jgi:alkaline phosphatase